MQAFIKNKKGEIVAQTEIFKGEKISDMLAFVSATMEMVSNNRKGATLKIQLIDCDPMIYESGCRE